MGSALRVRSLLGILSLSKEINYFFFKVGYDKQLSIEAESLPEAENRAIPTNTHARLRRPNICLDIY